MPKTHNPLLFPLAFLIAGIVTGSYLELSIIYYYAILLVVLILFIVKKSQNIKSICLYLTFFILGCIFFIVNDLSTKSTHFSKQQSDYLYFTISSKEKTKKGFRYFGNVNNVESAKNQFLSVGKLLVYTDSTFVLEKHSTYLIGNDFKEIKTFTNPGKFDYGTFLANQNIFHRTYLNTTPEKIDDGNRLLVFLNMISTKGKRLFISKFSDEENAAFLNALLLGDKRGMGKENRELFINNGLAHLLAISGMHVGIILIILNGFFSFITLPKFKGVIVILGIWVYILLSGLQIPAIRAGFMFTVYLIGQFSNRNIKGLNSVFFAALVLLSINPLLIFQLSFQLSFTAMASILIFYKKIFEIFTFKNQLTTKVWQLIALNISVQILVLPLSIYYFKQFPTYSIITSILSMPFIIVFMWGGVIALIASFHTWISDAICQSLEALIELYLMILEQISTLPYSLIENMEIHVIQLIFWTAGVLGFYFFIQKRNLNINLASTCFAPLVLVSSLLNITNGSTHKIVIYDDPHQIIVDYVSDGATVRYKQDPKRHSFQVENNSEENVTTKPMKNQNQFSGKSITVIKSTTNVGKLGLCDVCIISTETHLPDLEKKCAKIVVPRHIEIDSTYENQYSILQKGAFIHKF